VIISRKIIWAWHATHMENKIQYFNRKFEGKTPLQRLSQMGMTIKLILKISREGVNWFTLARDGVKWGTVMKREFPIPIKKEEFLITE
jgi:hypothetical protein